jgi:hypothetical protein
MLQASKSIKAAERQQGLGQEFGAAVQPVQPWQSGTGEKTASGVCGEESVLSAQIAPEIETGDYATRNPAQTAFASRIAEIEGQKHLKYFYQG